MLRSTLCAAMLVSSVALAADAPPTPAEHVHHWSYQGGTGPAKWGKLEEDYQVCGLGHTQSPIDIQDAVAKKADLAPIAFDYKPSPLKLIDNGHTVQVTYAPGSSITAQGKRYELVQFHFHHPSEEKVNGKRADMVAHLVHKDADGNLAVVAVLLHHGAANALIDTLWKHLPTRKEQEVDAPGVDINAADLLPANHDAYYAYTGSLTTPPCSENVAWFVMKAPTTVSSEEVARFAKLYPMNARPTQPLNGREILSTR
jgi:carbonic anhydrase